MKKIRKLLQETPTSMTEVEEDFHAAYVRCKVHLEDDTADGFWRFQNALADLIHAARLIGYVRGGGDVDWFAALGELRAFPNSSATAAEDMWRKTAAMWAKS